MAGLPAPARPGPRPPPRHTVPPTPFVSSSPWTSWRWKLAHGPDPVQGAADGAGSWAELMSQPKEYEGREVTVTFESRRCLHAAECVRGIPHVFDLASRPWVQPDGAAADRVAEVVRRCPSGALQ